MNKTHIRGVSIGTIVDRFMAGESLTAIAESIGMSKQALSRHLKDLGVVNPREWRKQSPAHKRRKYWPNVPPSLPVRRFCGCRAGFYEIGGLTASGKRRVQCPACQKYFSLMDP